MAKKNKEIFIKAVLIGNPNVGKTSLLCRYCDDKFEENYLPTIGVDFKFKKREVEGG